MQRMLFQASICKHSQPLGSKARTAPRGSAGGILKIDIREGIWQARTTMNRTTLAILAALFASIALAEDFKTITGKEYKNASVSRIEPDGIVLKSKSGIAKSYFTELPENVQERFHHNSAQKRATAAQQNASFAEDRLGGTADQFAARYGAPQDSPALDKNFPLLEGAIHNTYEFEGWKIRVAFVESDGRAVRMEDRMNQTGVSPIIQDYELQAIMTANTPAGTTWKQIGYHNPDSPNNGLNKVFESYFGDALGQKMWQRSDGAILWFTQHTHCALGASRSSRIRNETQSGKGTKVRQSVPQF